MKGEADFTAPLTGEKSGTNPQWRVLPPLSERTGESAPKNEVDLRLSITSRISTIESVAGQILKKAPQAQDDLQSRLRDYRALRAELGENLETALANSNLAKLEEINDKLKNILELLTPITPSMGRLDFKNPA